MMKSTLKNQFNIPPRTVIVGKWHKNRYTIIRELGSGANGIVYLAKLHDKAVALKLSDNGMSITSEVNVLKSFAKVQGSSLGPSLLDVDDWIFRGEQISFYAMEYIQGDDFLSFIRKKGDSWIEVLISQLLKDLQELHNIGWVFGDLKPENLIVSESPPRIRCIDVGGTTIQGRAIKEYTDFYDRGYWGLGSRKAEPTYDLFAVAMIVINTQYARRFQKTSGGLTQLRKMIREKPLLMKYERFLLQALNGHYTSAQEMRRDLLRGSGYSVISSKATSATNIQSRTTVNQPTSRVKQKKRRRIETIIITFIISFLYIWYIYGYLLS